MDDVIEQLEIRIRGLISQCNHLKETNQRLRQNKAELSREKELLQAKNKIAINQLESMINRLKAIEKPQ